MNAQKSSETVAVLGASPKHHRYAFKAMKLLKEYGHKPVPVNPAYDQVLDETCYPKISDVARSIDTVTVYVGEARSTPLIDEIVAVRPQRIIMNPGTENDALAQKARAHGIKVVEGCTLVMLRAGTF
jgi:predicted CoA-binding protein